jgi:two-component system, LytTR family, sensor kinase
MKTTCEGCARPLEPDGEAYICSYECTFCADCASGGQNICPHCGGELVRRPRRGISAEGPGEGEAEVPIRNRPGLIWAASFGIWTIVSLAATATIYQLYHAFNSATHLGMIAGMEFSQILAYAPLTPFVFALALRYPLQRANWGRRLLLHLAAGLLFSVAHIIIRGATPYGYFDPKYREWGSALWDSHAHAFRHFWPVLRSMFFGSVVDDVTGAYVTIVLVAHALSYYRRFRERELRASQLEGQLAKAHLQTLKSQLQPHFLFNTMHSISALMLTDVKAADRMMSLLSDLLRISLETADTQITTLKRELEFVNCYIEIEKVRFEERMNVIFDVMPETLDALVPHLLLQPLVDNAVKHGISRLTGAGEIRITVSRQNNELQLEIKDNGPGLDGPGTLPTNGLGLAITRERLETLFGEHQSLELLSPPEGGVAIRVCIPFQVQPGEESRETPANQR